MVSALPLASLPVLATRCSNAAGLPLTTALVSSFLAKVISRLVGGQLPLVHGDFYIAAKYPEAVVEVQVRCLLVACAWSAVTDMSPCEIRTL